MSSGTLANASPLEFVVGNRPDQLKGYSHRRLRSHVSRRAWKGVREPAASPLPPPPSLSSDIHAAYGPSVTRPKSQRRLTNKTFSIAYEYVSADAVASPVRPAGGAGPADEMERVSMTLRHRLQRLLALSRRAMPIDRQLGGGRVDPFHAHPGPWRSFIPALTDHYIVHMAVNINELDGPGQVGLLRTRWYPMVLSDPSTFAVVLLLSAANYISTSRNAEDCESPSTTSSISVHDDYVAPSQPLPGRRHLLHFKQAAIGAINAALSDPGRQLSDEVIGAVAKMASFEAMHGDLASYQTHMDGLRMMLGMRGGLSSLGLDGLLRRIVVWIDLNSSFLLGTSRYFPYQSFAGVETPQMPDEPNPAQFNAVS